MKGTLLETSSGATDSDGDSSRSLSLIAVICAFVITGLVVSGYLYLRKRHAQQTMLAAQSAQGPAVEPKGPPKAQIFVDDAMTKGAETLIGGTVRNISNESLNSLTVDLELIRRKDATTQKTSVPVQPSQLAPQEEAPHSLPLPTADYTSLK